MSVVSPPLAGGGLVAFARDLAYRVVAEPLEFWLHEVAPTFSLSETLAEVVAVVDETPDIRTFVLAPNARFRGHRAGQWVPVDVEIDGVRVRRCYSISSAPGGARLSITVKRVPGGRVSGFLHENARVGAILRLGEAQGDYVLPARAPARLLLVSGGSGATPNISILRDLVARGAVPDVVYLHYARTLADVPFAKELQGLAAVHPSLQVVLQLDDGPPRDLAELVPDFADRETFLCGPTGLMDLLRRRWAEAGAIDHLHEERFVAPTYARVDSGKTARITLSRARRTLAVTGAESLLEGLERAGERPDHGCRIGICHTCRCRKRSGVVQDLVTGAISDAPDEEIRLCTSVARSDLDLAL